MDPIQILAWHDQEQRKDLQERGMRREEAPGVVRHVNLESGEGMVIFSSLTEADADRAIAEQVACFEALGQDFEWKLYGHDTPGDLAQRLLAHGFEPEPQEAFLVLDLEEAPETLFTPTGSDIRRLTDPAEVADIGRIQKAVWGGCDPSWLTHLENEILHHADNTLIYVAYDEGHPVSHARICFHEGSAFAGLWGGSTLKEARNRGFYTALLAIRAREARQRGVRFLTIDASPMSRPIVEKRGFQYLTFTQPFKWHVHTPGGSR